MKLSLNNLDKSRMTGWIRTQFRTVTILAVAVAGITPCYGNPIIVIPPGLRPGAPYRLVFVTSGTTDAKSSDISTYNTFVTNAADAVPALNALGATWKVIASTGAVDAITNIMQDPGVPIYNLEGQKVADDATTAPGGLFSGSLLTAILYNELGGQNANTEVWTGTNVNGTGVPGLTLGFGPFAERGESDASTQAWVANGTKVSSLGLSVYAISSVLIACVPPPNSAMVAWYPFDELTGTTSANLATANTGTQYNGPLGIASGKVAGAASFNGINQYVESPSSIVSTFGPGQTAATCSTGSNNREGDYSSCRGNFSIDTWVQVTSSSGVMTIVDKRSGSQPAILGYSFFLSNDSMGLQLADGLGSQGYSNYLSPTLLNLTDGNWHHIAVTVDRLVPTTGITWYHNGTAIGNSDPTDRPGSLVSSSPLRIGTNTTAAPLSNWFKGNLDELEIYNRVLTADEVLGIFNADTSGKCKPLPPPAACGFPSSCPID